MSEIREASRRAAVLRALADLVKEAEKDSRVDVDRELRALAEETGTESVTATLPDGTAVATFKLAGGKPVARVTDERKFFEWVEVNHPSEIVPQVRAMYRECVIKACERAGAPVDPQTGEEIPGVEVETATKYLTTKFLSGGREAVAQAWNAGRLAGIAPTPELAKGEGSQ